jgi:hypothetical protein
MPDSPTSSQRTYGKGFFDAGGDSGTTSTSSVSPDSRLIFGLMMWSVGFSLVGHEIDVKAGPTLVPNATTAATSGGGALNALAQNEFTGTTGGAKIVIGGFAATALLSLMAHAGDAGRTFAVGLAVISAVASTLVFGKPFWNLLDRIVGKAGPGGTASGTTAGTGTTGTTSATPVTQAA